MIFLHFSRSSAFGNDTYAFLFEAGDVPQSLFMDVKNKPTKTLSYLLTIHFYFSNAISEKFSRRGNRRSVGRCERFLSILLHSINATMIDRCTAWAGCCTPTASGCWFPTNRRATIIRAGSATPSFLPTIWTNCCVLVVCNRN